MATEYSIVVTYVAGLEPTLQVETGEIVLDDDTLPIHSVVWRFIGIETLVVAGWKAVIRFDVEDGAVAPTYQGPFLNLCGTGEAVIACGNSGKEGTYNYRAVLEAPLHSSDSDVVSDPVQVTNNVKEEKSAAIRVVSSQSNPNELEVIPNDVSFVVGQSLLWEVVEPPVTVEAWYPRLAFESGTVGMNGYLGPFGSLDIRDDSILGTGSSGKPGVYNYRFQMVSLATHEPLFESSPDPTIDDEGEPGIHTPEVEED